MMCKRCSKRVKYPSSISWQKQICPHCADNATRATGLQPLNDDLIIVREANPIDVFWNWLTVKELIRTGPARFN